MTLDTPDWQQFVQWETPHLMITLMGNRTLVPALPGFYAFNLDQQALRRDRVLYVGETAQAGGMRARMREYLHPDPASIKTTHKAALFLQDYKMQNPSQPVYVRWAPLEADKRVLRDVEAALIQTYNCWFNSRDYSKETPFDTQ